MRNGQLREIEEESKKELYEKLLFLILKTVDLTTKVIQKEFRLKKKHSGIIIDWFLAFYTYETVKIVLNHPDRPRVDSELFKNALSYRIIAAQDADYLDIWTQLAAKDEAGENFIQFFATSLCKELKLDVYDGPPIAMHLASTTKHFFKGIDIILKKHK